MHEDHGQISEHQHFRNETGKNAMSLAAREGNYRKSYLPFPLELEECECAICSTSNSRALLDFDAFGFPTGTVECQGCGLVYVNPRPTRRYMENFYRKWFRLFYEGRRKIDEGYIRDKKWREWDESRVKRYAAYLRSKERVLDIGCGAGYFAAQAKIENAGCRAVGIEPDSMMAGFAREKLNVEVHEGFFETFESSDKYDVITAFHVIEHLFDLGAFFQFLHKHLTKNGQVIIETPNVTGSWRGTGMFHIAHLYTFSPRTIGILFAMNGFEVLEVGPLENELDHSNLYVVAQRGAEAKSFTIRRDSKESALVDERCRSVAKVRTIRVLRNWLKMLYFAIRS